jgi:hypothetical protein
MCGAGTLPAAFDLDFPSIYPVRLCVPRVKSFSQLPKSPDPAESRSHTIRIWSRHRPPSTLFSTTNPVPKMTQQ